MSAPMAVVSASPIKSTVGTFNSGNSYTTGCV